MNDGKSRKHQFLRAGTVLFCHDIRRPCRNTGACLICGSGAAAMADRCNGSFCVYYMVGDDPRRFLWNPGDPVSAEK